MIKLNNKNYTTIKDTSISDGISLAPINKSIYIPNVNIKEPTESDYINGYIYRYFYRQANDKNSLVIEIPKVEYDKASRYFLYKTLRIKWKIIGNKDNTYNINKKISDDANKLLSGISKILERNLLLYWKDIPDANSEFDITNKLLKK